MEPSNHRSARFAITLREIFILVTAVAISLGWCIDHKRLTSALKIAEREFRDVDAVFGTMDELVETPESELPEAHCYLRYRGLYFIANVIRDPSKKAHWRNLAESKKPSTVKQWLDAAQNAEQP
jgi:hypothetical protein